jgi:hypothetical protein
MEGGGRIDHRAPFPPRSLAALKIPTSSRAGVSAAKDLKMRKSGILRSFGVFAPDMK